MGAGGDDLHADKAKKADSKPMPAKKPAPVEAKAPMAEPAQTRMPQGKFDMDGDLGNDEAGIQLGNSTTGVSNDALIGGTSGGQGNTIAFNGQVGIDLPLSGTGNSFLGNSIFSNSGLGIDLGTSSPSPGRTANDTDDADTIGGNELQNFPVLTSAVSSGGTTTVGGSLDTNASETISRAA